MARRRLERIQRSTEFSGGILDLFERLSPTLARPHHFDAYTQRLEQSVGGGLRIAFSAPPQHGKTLTTLHALVWLSKRYPSRRHAYITYNADRATSVHVSRTFRRLLSDAGIQPSGTLADVSLPGGGAVIFRGIDGGITGEPVDGLCVLDDIFKNRQEAESARRREVVIEAYRSAVEPRVHPGASIVSMATRWDPEDLSGVLQREGWEVINLPAIAEEGDPNGRAVGEPLFPELWPLDALLEKKRRTLDFTWDALYQGHPRPRGGKIFRDPSWYTRLPKIFAGAYGIDLAYTKKTSADWSVCVLMYREDRDGRDPLYYVVHMDRAQVEAPAFALTLRARHAQRKAAKMFWRAGGTEKGAAQFLIRMGLPIVVRNPPGDKLVSATPLAAAWNDGRVVLPDIDVFPDEAEWVLALLDRVRDFTGATGGKDDEIDALGNAFDALDISQETRKPGFASLPYDGRGGGRII